MEEKRKLKNYHKQKIQRKNRLFPIYNYTKKLKEIYKKMPKHSAYRSGRRENLRKRFQQKHGNAVILVLKKKYGLSRWFKEEWKNQRGNIGYKFKNDVYRPTIRITDKAPNTFDELKPKK